MIERSATSDGRGTDAAGHQLTMRKLAVMLALIAGAGIAGAAVRASAVEVTAACANALGLDATTRKAHSELIRHVLVDAFPARNDANAARFAIDASLIELDVATTQSRVEIRARVHAVVSDGQGRIVWLGACGAKIQIPARSFRASQLAQYQREAIDAATTELLHPLRAELRRARTRQTPTPVAST